MPFVDIKLSLLSTIDIPVTETEFMRVTKLAHLIEGGKCQEITVCEFPSEVFLYFRLFVLCLNHIIYRDRA